MAWAVVSFDLTGVKDYEKAYSVLNVYGFVSFTPYNKVSLPTTLVMREVPDGTSAERLRDLISAAFRAAGLTPKKVFGGVLEDWATIDMPAQTGA
jgi:hypothetical protein